MSNNLEMAVIALSHALREQLITLEFIKVDQLPTIDGKEIASFYGVPFRTHIYEHEADVWIAGVEDRTPPTSNQETKGV